MTHRRWSHVVAALLLAVLFGSGISPLASSQVVPPPEGEDYAPIYTLCGSDDGITFTCTWLIESDVRERVEVEERACNLGWSHRKATQTVTTTIFESYETYREDIVYAPDRYGGDLLTFTYYDQTQTITSDSVAGECRPITGRPPAN